MVATVKAYTVDAGMNADSADGLLRNGIRLSELSGGARTALGIEEDQPLTSVLREVPGHRGAVLLHVCNAPAGTTLPDFIKNPDVLVLARTFTEKGELVRVTLTLAVAADFWLFKDGKPWLNVMNCGEPGVSLSYVTEHAQSGEVVYDDYAQGKPPTPGDAARAWMRHVTGGRP